MALIKKSIVLDEVFFLESNTVLHYSTVLITEPVNHSGSTSLISIARTKA